MAGIFSVAFYYQYNLQRGWVGWVVAKPSQLGHPWRGHDASRTIAHAMFGQRGNGSNLEVPTTHLAPSIGAIVPVVTVEGQQNVPQESTPVDI